jgi:hypothetical protein
MSYTERGSTEAGEQGRTSYFKRFGIHMTMAGQ